MALLRKINALNIGIIHLSDIHFCIENEFPFSKWELLYKALKDDFISCFKLYIIISGDIASNGKVKEYDIAYSYLMNLKDSLSHRYPTTAIKIILAPGNHDCNFDLDTQVRINNIKNVNYDTLGNDGSFFQVCTQVQKEFWDFYCKFNDEPQNKLYYQVTENVGEKKLCFHCFNTAWMSQKKEIPGSLFFPVKNMENLIKNKDYDLNISVFHHPINWFNPTTKENNKKEFQNLLDHVSSLHIVGHEHENELRITEDIDKIDSKALYSLGDVLQDHQKPNESGFQTLLINLNNNDLKLRRYIWKNNIYQRHAEDNLLIYKKIKRQIELDQSFKDKINTVNLPIIINDKQVTLSEIYIFPDIEDITTDSDNIIDYIDSELLLNGKSLKCILGGESQIGKSSLLYMLFLRYYEKGYYPIFLEGKDITSDDVDKIILKAFKVQYSDNLEDYEFFRQFDKQSKILLIDDLHKCKYYTHKHSIFEQLSDLFYNTLITIDSGYGLLPQCQTIFKDTSIYLIKPLGYKKSHDLVERYLTIKDSSFYLDPSYLHKTKHTFNQLRQILGNKLIPSYPIFILSIIQSLELIPHNLNETSYGYCYQTLIHYALNSAGVFKDDVDSYMNIITELAFYMFNLKRDSINENEFEAFHDGYRGNFIIPNFETVKKILLKSMILKMEEGYYCFAYKYILFFLTAKKVAEMMDTPEGKEIVTELYKELHKEKNANILVFITHHTKNKEFIEDSIFTSMLPFENILPITLETHSAYYKLLEEILKDVEQQVIENRDPVEERKKQLIAQDKIERNKKNEEEEEDVDISDKIVPFLQAFRSIEIVGQIIKNRKGSLKISTLKEMITELYNTGFRMIGYLGDMINEIKGFLASRVEEKLTEKDTNQIITKRIYVFLNYVSLQACLGIFTRIVFSVGIKELKEIYTEVANEINTPAAKLVSFSINSYYDKLNMKELEQLCKEFKGNMVALEILRARVKAYIYNNHIEYWEKQKIANHLNLKILPDHGHKDRGF
jgi:hypothetical protein